MRWINYILLVCILLISHEYYAYSEVKPTTEKGYQPMRITEENDEDTKEIRIRKDEFDEIVGQLQGMKALLENMKQTFDTRLSEMQEKIATLEKEKEQLQGNKVATVKVDSNNLEACTTNETQEQKTIPAQTNTITTSPSPTQTDTEFIPPPRNTASTNQPSSTESGKWYPAQPLTLWSMGKNYMNISFDGLFAAAGSTAKNLDTIEKGGHDPNQRGFTVQNLETVFDGAIDPYFKGQSVLVFQIDKNGASSVEVEEAYLTTMSLPLNLQAKAGTFFTEFGRLNPTHPHTWDFADQPLVNGRFFGPDGLRNPGMRLSWLAPADNYTELFFTIQDSQGNTAFSFRNSAETFSGRSALDHKDQGVRSMGDMLYVPRIATSFDLTEEQTLLLGASAAFGPNSTGTDKNTQIYGLDMFWKWKSKYASGGFPFVTWQTEVMGRYFAAGANVGANLPEEVLNDWGAYSQIAWGIKPRWVAALRGDYADGEKYATDASEFERLRISPNLTFYPSEFAKIRLQYNYDEIAKNNSEYSVFLQFEFLLGAHAAHKF